MKTTQRFTFIAVTLAMVAGTGGCAGMSKQGQNTAVGAGVGAVGGAVWPAPSHPSGQGSDLRTSRG